MTSDREKWAAEALIGHSRLAPTACNLLEAELKAHKIEYLSIAHRIKNQKSIIEKIDRKSYTDYEKQITDISGIRIICFLESEIQKIEKIIKGFFEIDLSNSRDRSAILGLDKIGYRSVHYICTLGKARSVLREYKDICDLKFEIQIRTVLQHAWAEMAHDRSFKFRAGLPATLERRPNLYAGMLEVIDQGFDNISKEIDDYNTKIEEKSSDEILESEVSSKTLKKFIGSIKNVGEVHDCEISQNIIKEIRQFGINKISDFEKIIDNNLIKNLNKYRLKNNYLSFIRHAMMYADIEKYLSTDFDWTGIDQISTDSLVEKYGQSKIDELFERNDITILDYDDED